MANNTISKSRIISKHDTTANWAKAVNFTPLNGELILYTDVNKIKIGDGKSNVNALPFSTIDADEFTESEIENAWNGV